MCGRIAQYRDIEHYWAALPVHPFATDDTARQRLRNLPPGPGVLVFHQLAGPQPAGALLHWGYKPPSWPYALLINARLDTVLGRSRFWRPLLTRRIILPVDGWFEWQGEKGGPRQPWYITSRDGEPIFLAGITAWTPGAPVGPETGFAIITDDAAHGLVDVHGRRPVALASQDAATWIDPATPVAAALELLATSRPETAFHCWRVTPAVNSSRYQKADVVQPLEPGNGPATLAHPAAGGRTSSSVD